MLCIYIGTITDRVKPYYTGQLRKTPHIYFIAFLITKICPREPKS